jgi:purine-binding chemotaxis protein CheW
VSARGERKAVDWDHVRQSLERSRRAIEGIDERDPAAVLAERTRALAALPAQAGTGAAPGEQLEVLVFSSGGERYAFDTAHIVHVSPRLPLTRIHGVPNYVVGIVAVDGEVYSVVDLRSLLQLPVARLVDPHAIILLRSQAMELGVLAEEIHGVERYPAGALEHALPAHGPALACLAGVAADGTAILDAARLLADPALVIEQP